MNSTDILTVGIPTAIAIGSFIFAYIKFKNQVTTDSVQIMREAIREQEKQLKTLQVQMTEMQIKYDGMATLVKAALIEYFGEHSEVAKALLAKV